MKNRPPGHRRGTEPEARERAGACSGNPARSRGRIANAAPFAALFPGRASGPRPGSRGFTLIELLLALLMTAILAGGLYQSLFAGRMAQRRAEESARLNQIGRAVLDAVRRDLECIVQEPGPFNAGLYGKNDETSEFPADSVSFLANSAFPLVKSSSEVDYEAADRTIESDLMLVEWGLGTDDLAGIVRKTKRCLTCTLFDDTPAWKSEDLAFEAVGLNFRYFDGSEWKDEWDSAESGTFPEAIEATVVIGLVEKVDGAVSLYDADGKPVETEVFRMTLVPVARPQNKTGAQAPVSGTVK